MEAIGGESSITTEDAQAVARDTVEVLRKLQKNGRMAG